MNSTTPDYGSPEWFANRAKESLVMKDGFWDFSDSALFWTDEVMSNYKDAQTDSEDVYKKQVTDSETAYLKKITPDLVSHLPQNINYVDLGPGTENKQDLFIDEIQRRGKKLMYTPVDINKSVIDLVGQHVTKKGIAIHPVHSSFEDMDQFLIDNQTPRFLSLGLTFGNFDIDYILDIFEKTIGKEGLAFINIQPREKVKDFEKLKQAYSGHLTNIYNAKLKLIGLKIDPEIGTIEVTDEVKVYYTVKKPSQLAKNFGIKEGDKLFVFQSMRYPIEFLKSKLESRFDCIYFDTEDDYLGILLKNK